MKDEAVNPVIREFVRTQADIEIDRYSDKGGFGDCILENEKSLMIGSL